MSGLKQELLEGKKKIGIWGLGYIGYSTMAYFAKHGIASLGTDIRKDRIEGINKGQGTIVNMDYWLGFNIKPLIKRKLMKATTDWKRLKDCPVHMVAIPTEKEGEPYHEILKDVINKICTFKNKPLIIIESTLTPTAVDKIVIPLIKENGLKLGKDIFLGVAPRRDWFTDSQHNLESLARVVGGSDKETTDLMADILGIVCKDIYKTKDYKHAAIVKSIENAYRQLDITFANQLTLAYPDLDMNEILRLVGTKWNIGTYFPSVGTSGYCIKIAPKYVLEGADNPEELTLLKESLKTDDEQVNLLAQKLIKKKYKKIGILGIAYTGDIRVHVLSRTIALINYIKKFSKAEIKVYDPYYNKRDTEKITGCEQFKFPEGLEEFQCIVIIPSHSDFKAVNQDDVINNLKKCREIIDNEGTWKHFKFPKKMTYHEIGGPGWLK